MNTIKEKVINEQGKTIIGKAINLGKNILLSTFLISYTPNIADINKKQTDIIPENKVYSTYMEDQYMKKIKLTVDTSINNMLNDEYKKYDKYVRPHNYIRIPEKTLYLTFDDGPSKYTKDVLNTLEKHNVKAVFFVVCSKINNSNMHIINKIIENGHILANHQNTHRIAKSNEDLKNLVGLCKLKIESIAPHQKEQLFRYPYGMRVKNGYKILQELGYQNDTMWDIDTNDWRFAAKHKNFDPNKFVEYTINNIKKQRGGIVLMHDIHKITAVSLDQIITKLKEDGYYFDILTTEKNNKNKT